MAQHLTTLPAEESSSQVIDILYGGVGTTELQDLSAVNHRPEVGITYVEASTLTSILGGITEHASSDLAQSDLHAEQRIAKGHQVMTVARTEHPHIVRDSRIGHGEPIILGTSIRVRTLVEYWREGTGPEDLLQQFPHLTLAQVFDALSYYQDHQEEIHTLIAQNRVDPTLVHESVRQHP